MPGPEAARKQLCAYVAIGPTLVEFSLDVGDVTLTRGAELKLPARVQYAWPHGRLPILYLGCAERTSNGQDERYLVCAVIRERSGLRVLQSVVLPARPIHLSTDAASRHLLVAYVKGAPWMSVYEIGEDGMVGAQIPKDQSFAGRPSPHQARGLPGDRAVLVCRGEKGFGTAAYQPGGLLVTDYGQGRIRILHTVSPQTPQGFNPRHLNFHPTKPFVFVTLEGQHQLCVFGMKDGDIAPELLHQCTTLVRPDDVRPRQDCGTVHVHPNGRFVYVANRNDGYVGGYSGPSWVAPDPIPIFPGGENNIAVFALDMETGEPRLIQNQDTEGLHPRTFALDPSGQVLMANNIVPSRFRDGDEIRDVPANLALFRIAADGRLNYVRRYDLETGTEKCWWSGIVAMPSSP